LKKEDFNNAKRIEKEIDKIKHELNIWEVWINKKSNLACNRHGCGFKTLYEDRQGNYESSMSDEVFSSFRKSVINELKIKIINLEEEFLKIGYQETNSGS